ncbi:MAG: hypothetical protein IPK16_29945 [Anaerolineales bacterium]|nr:hypothetical protein [Anaerolineales bacterium]
MFIERNDLPHGEKDQRGGAETRRRGGDEEDYASISPRTPRQLRISALIFSPSVPTVNAERRWRILVLYSAQPGQETQLSQVVAQRLDFDGCQRNLRQAGRAAVLADEFHHGLDGGLGTIAAHQREHHLRRQELQALGFRQVAATNAAITA